MHFPQMKWFISNNSPGVIGIPLEKKNPPELSTWHRALRSQSLITMLRLRSAIHFKYCSGFLPFVVKKKKKGGGGDNNKHHCIKCTIEQGDVSVTQDQGMHMGITWVSMRTSSMRNEYHRCGWGASMTDNAFDNAWPIRYLQRKLQKLEHVLCQTLHFPLSFFYFLSLSLFLS